MEPNQTPATPPNGGVDPVASPSQAPPAPPQPAQPMAQAPTQPWQQPAYSQPTQPQYGAQPQYAPYPPQPAARGSAAPEEDEQKDYVIAFLLSWLLGVIGADRFYLGYTGLGVAKLLTLGGLGLWAYIDVALLAFGKMKDKAGLPLKGYAKNKTWTRVLAILHLLVLPLLILFFILSVVFTSVPTIQKNARDTERKTDINALQGGLEMYFANNAKYPTLDQMNNPTFRANSLKLPDTDFQDPQGTGSLLVNTVSVHAYEYQVAPTGCDNVKVTCNSYSLSAQLEDGTAYTKLPLSSNSADLKPQPSQ